MWRKKNKKTYILLLQHLTIELEGNMKGIDTDELIETNQDRIDQSKLIRTICHLQDNEKKYVLAAAETDKKVYLFYQAIYQSNEDDLEVFKAHIRVSGAHNGSVGYHLGLSEIELQENHNITSNTKKRGPED